ncbi:MAG: hypothetical protein WDN75_10200 [Bacteroidota bacterium]
MNRKITIGIIGCFIGSVTVVLILFLLSGELRDKRNSFLRQFPPRPVLEGDTLSLKFNSFYLAGLTPHTVYLGNYTAPLHMLVVNLDDLTDTLHVLLDVKGTEDKKFWSARVAVDSPYFYLYDGVVPAVYKGRVKDWHAERILTDSIYFREIVPLSPESFAVKSLSGRFGENILGKLTSTPPFQVFNDSILQKQLDGIFCTDGMLLNDVVSKKTGLHVLLPQPVYGNGYKPPSHVQG